jgi:primosomal protein N'
MNWDIIPIQKLTQFDFLTYYAPDHIKLIPGQLVYIPLRQTIIAGIVLRYGATKTSFTPRNIAGLYDLHPVLTASQLDFCEKLSDYYFSTLSEICYQLLPAKLRTVNKKVLAQKIWPLSDYHFSNTTHKQDSKLDAVYIQGTLKQRLKLYKKELQGSKRQALFITPDLGSVLHVVKDIFPDAIYLDTSTIKSEMISWQNIAKTKPKISIGSHKAILSPITNLGIIILDQENHPRINYGQKPYYDLRQACLFLAKSTNSKLYVGSSVPSVFISSLIQKQVVKKQVSAPAQLATIDTYAVDLSGGHNSRNELTHQSDAIIQENIRQTRKTGVLTFSKSFSTGIICTSCYQIVRCTKCKSKIIVQDAQHTTCGFCQHKDIYPTVCPTCSSDKLTGLRMGKSALTEYVLTQNPAVVLYNHENPKAEFQVAILTPQDLNRVTQLDDLIIYRPEALLFSTSYTARERLGNLIYASRLKAKRVHLETEMPDNPIWHSLENPENFIIEEIKERKAYALPPAKHILKIVAQDIYDDTVKKLINKIRAVATPSYDILGPVSRRISDGSNVSQYYIKYDESQQSNLLKLIKLGKSENIKYIVDPTDL